MEITFSSIWDPNSQTRLEATKSPLTVGRDGSCDVVLASPLVAQQAAAFVYKNGIWRFRLFTGSAKIDDRTLGKDSKADITSNCVIELGPFLLTVTHSKEVVKASDPKTKLDFELNNLLAQVHLDLFEILDLKHLNQTRKNNPEFIQTVERKIEGLAVDSGLFDESQAELMRHTSGCSVRHQLLEYIDSPLGNKFWGSTDSWVDMQTMVPEHELDARQKVSAITKILKPQLDKVRKEKHLDVVNKSFWNVWAKVASRSFPEPLHYLAIRHVKKQIKDTLFGFGPLEDLLRSSSVSEIMVVDSNHIYVERNGKLLNSGRKFLSDKVTEAVIQRIVAKVGRRIDKAKPMVDARLPDGSRVNAVIPPVAIKGPCLTIRKFPQQGLRIDDLVANSSLTTPARSFLQACVQNKCNILISGGTGSGKTTLLNCLTEFFGENERIVTIEDTAELQVLQEHVVGMETKEENIEGVGALSIRDLVRNSLRMRPSRIIVGEVRGGEAIDMLQAMNTGHSGCLTTVHSNSPADAVSRLEVLVASDSDLPVISIRQQIVSAIHIIVQLNRVGPRRLVTAISEVLELDEKTNRIRLRNLFEMRERSIREPNQPDLRGDEDDLKGEVSLSATGRLPTFIGELLEKEIIDKSAFLSV